MQRGDLRVDCDEVEIDLLNRKKGGLGGTDYIYEF
jgi:hypothetical protein